MYKTLDNKGRWRNVIISFRMSPQERDDLNVRVKLSGLTKTGLHNQPKGRNFDRIKANKQRC